METPTKREPMTREKARAIINRLLADSMETRRQMEESYRTDPGIQTSVAELRAANKQQERTNAGI